MDSPKIMFWRLMLGLRYHKWTDGENKEQNIVGPRLTTWHTKKKIINERFYSRRCSNTLLKSPTITILTFFLSPKNSHCIWLFQSEFMSLPLSFHNTYIKLENTAWSVYNLHKQKISESNTTIFSKVDNRN